ncbi:MAG: glycoside hydrolase family 97 catalytic domain-containing protein [Prevotellaceae bacterium]|nr:glycoside hydrolase family 97 catalytic domain-containing protein [Prevotellaceae bacterium]
MRLRFSYVLRIAMALFAVASVTMVSAEEYNVASPDGRIDVSISDDGGRLHYETCLDGVQMLQPSALGLLTSVGDFSKGLQIVGEESRSVNETYKMRNTKASHVYYCANELTLRVKNAAGQQFSVQFRVSNRDVAFRYLLERQGKDGDTKRTRVLRELSAFNPVGGTKTFLCPQIGPETGWEQTKPSYEERYLLDQEMNVRSQFGLGYTFPCLFRVPSSSNDSRSARPEGALSKQSRERKNNNYWMLISETGVTSQYCGSHLSDYTVGEGYSIAFPHEGENNATGSVEPSVTLPSATPWRTITMGSTLAPIVETTVAYDLVSPLYQPSIAYKGGRYTWSWLVWQDESINYDDQVQFIDLASKMGFEYTLVDNWWDERIGRDRIAELSRYAQERGVSLMLWYNSNGSENDAPQTPRDCMSTSIARHREMAWLRSIGVKGIKVDFFGGDKQQTMQLYEDILADANLYGIQVIFHGCTLPRGWERMYPNFVASEAVLASENVFFNPYHAQNEGVELTLHPFIRNAVASMDWGGVIMNKYLSRDNKSRHRRATSDMFEIATAITNQSEVNCIAMQPNNLSELPAIELELLRDMPTQWDETRFIDGYPGRYVVMARRHADRWYIAALNGTGEPLSLDLSLPMLDGTAFTLYTDGKQKAYDAMKTAKVKLKLPALAGALIK